METNANEYGRVQPPTWDEAWIVAGGRSALNFDLSRLNGKRVVAVNDALFRVGRFPALQVTSFSCDNNWIREHRRFLTRSRCEKYLAVPLETWPDCGGIDGVTYLRWSHADGLSNDPTAVCTGGNSGYAAINLAWLKGAATIHLLGYDMNPADNAYYAEWALRFHTMLPQLARRGVKVVNHNHESFIDTFPKE